jgi:hypothetical protein
MGVLTDKVRDKGLSSQEIITSAYLLHSHISGSYKNCSNFFPAYSPHTLFWILSACSCFL